MGYWAEEQVAEQEAVPEAPVREKAPPERFDLKISRDWIFLSLTQTMSEKCIIHFHIDPTNC